MIPTPHTTRHLWLDRLAPVVALLGGLLLFALFRGHGFDDSYITYRYADNLARGLGFVYNPGERALSTTAPLLALLLAPAAWLGLDLPETANLLSCLCYGLGGLALYRLGRLGGEPLAGAAAGSLYATFPLFYRAIGGETALLQVLLLWGFVATAAARYSTAALLLGLATLARADAALAALIAGLLIVANAWRGLPADGRGLRQLLAALPWRAAGAYALVVLPWLLFCWAYFGHPLPLTLAAKRLQAAVPGTRLFGPALLAYIGAFWQSGLLRPLFLLAPIGLAAALRRPLWLLPIGWGLLHAGAYVLLGVPGYFWYTLPAFAALLAAAGLAVGVIAAIARARATWLAPALALALLAPPLVGAAGALVDIGDDPDGRLAPYRAAGEWIAANSAPGESVGALEVGVIGFYSRRQMIDFAGLIQPDVARVFGAGAGYAEAGRYAVARYRPDLLVLQEHSLPLAGLAPDAPDRCVLAATIPAPRLPAPLTIYRCRW